MITILEDYKKSSFFKILKNTLLFNKMVVCGDKILVAVSGGADSIALLYCLKILSFDLNINIGVVHLNHMLRGINSEWDSSFVEFISLKLSVPFYTRSVNIRRISKILNLSVEEVGRKMRHAYFSNIMRKKYFSKIALAQHMNDNAESALMSLFRGSGMSGLSGMLPVYEDSFIRPFIFVRKDQILEFLIKNKIKYIEDKSNKDLKYTRNRIRNKLIPFISSFFNPKIVDSLNKISNIAYIEDEFTDKIVTFEYNRSIVYYRSNVIVMSINVLNSVHISIKKRIFRKVFCVLFGSLNGVRFEYVESILNLIKNFNGDGRTIFLNSVKITRFYNRIEFSKVYKEHVVYSNASFCSSLSNKIVNKSAFPLTLQNDYYSFTFSIIPKLEICMLGKFTGKNVAFFDLEKLRFPVAIRFVSCKDRFNVFGIENYKKISKFFIDRKIPISEREKSLVVQFDNEIVWVVMHEICNHVKVSKITKNVLMVKFCLLKM